MPLTRITTDSSPSYSPQKLYDNQSHLYTLYSLYPLFISMASATVQLPTADKPTLLTTQPVQTPQDKPRHIQTTLNYFKDHPDGSPPTPNYVGDPTAYRLQPIETAPATIHDVSGHELDYTLDANGFQFYYHTSAEKDFLDDEQIKRVYYPETEQLLKDAYVQP